MQTSLKMLFNLKGEWIGIETVELMTRAEAETFYPFMEIPPDIQRAPEPTPTKKENNETDV